MTIDSSWIACFKEEIPAAFTQNPPFRARAVFCDGQIRLMRGNNREDAFLTWDAYVWQQFQAHVQRFFDRQGVTTVILAFDDYAHVPAAKCMTQVKRRKHLPKLDILEREPLPTVCPSGERWTQCIANRVFKSKVIALVVQSLPRLLRLTPGQSLIIDYAGCPEEYAPDAEGKLTQRRTLTELAPLGEADIKFTRYAGAYGDLLVDSVDGDSVPIALLHYEAALSGLTAGSMRVEDLQGRPPQICIHRMTTRVAEEKEKDESEGLTKEAKKLKKRARGEQAGGEGGVGGQDADPSAGEAKKGGPTRTYEYVNIPLLHQALRDVICQSNGRLNSPSHGTHYMSMLLALIGLTGTDFSRNMPQLSGKTVFGMLPDVWLGLMQAYRPATGQLDINFAADNVVATLYLSKFASHFRGCDGETIGSLGGVLDRLQMSKLSQRTRDALPTIPRIVCTLRNVNWLLQYWRDAGTAEDPLASDAADGSATYGFLKLKGGAVTYAA